MKITFVLPPPSMRIAGGYKMVYTYANFFAGKGHDVVIVYNGKKGANSRNLNEGLVMFLRRLIMLREPSWMYLDKKIRKVLVSEITQRSIPDGDAVVATSYDTAHDVNMLTAGHGKKFYFIQDYEKWGCTDRELISTYRYDMQMITVAEWLKDIVDTYAVHPAVCIRNGIDTVFFRPLTDPSHRNPHSVAMLYHTDVRKCSQTGISIIRKLKEKYPDMEANLFGSPKRPADLPQWINYTSKANARQVLQIYNSSAVFLCTSSVEGFGLTGAESMACGCALVSTDCKGVLEYASDGENALLCKAVDENELFDAVCRLFDSSQLRHILSTNAIAAIQSISESYAKEKFYCVITGEHTDE